MIFITTPRLLSSYQLSAMYSVYSDLGQYVTIGNYGKRQHKSYRYVLASCFDAPGTDVHKE